MTFHIVIPARLKSTRLPEKPLKDIAGRPMIVRVAERAALAGAASVTVATDDQSIVAACDKYGVKAVMTDANHASGTDRIAEVAEKAGWGDNEVIVNVQGDEPLIDPVLVSETAKLVSSTVPMATAAHVIENTDDVFNPNCVKVVLDKNSRALYFSRAAIPWYRDGYGKGEFPQPFNVLRHVGLYAYTCGFLKGYASLEKSPLEAIESLEQLRALYNGYPIAVHVTASAPAAGVDTPEDLERVRAAFAAMGVK